MNKSERLEYMRKRFPVLEQMRCDAVSAPNTSDITDEVNRLDTFDEYKREKKENVLLSDET